MVGASRPSRCARRRAVEGGELVAAERRRLRRSWAQLRAELRSTGSPAPMRVVACASSPSCSTASDGEILDDSAERNSIPYRAPPGRAWSGDRRIATARGALWGLNAKAQVAPCSAQRGAHGCRSLAVARRAVVRSTGRAQGFEIPRGGGHRGLHGRSRFSGQVSLIPSRGWGSSTARADVVAGQQECDYHHPCRGFSAPHELRL